MLAAQEAATLYRERDGRDFSLRFTFNESICVLLITDVTESMAAARSKNEFIANVTHEMNPPLTSIRGFAELMAAGSLPPERAQHAAKTIIKQSDRLANLVKSIINFSQIDSDELPDEDVNLSELVREAASVFEPKLQKRSISFTLDVAENVKVRSRRERLFEIVNNLISNGVRYNRDGGTLAVTLTGGEEPVFTVRDNGHRHCGGGQGAHFRPLLHRRQVARRRGRRVRAGACHRQKAVQARGLGALGGEQARRRHGVLRPLCAAGEEGIKIFARRSRRAKKIGTNQRGRRNLFRLPRCLYSVIRKPQKVVRRNAEDPRDGGNVVCRGLFQPSAPCGDRCGRHARFSVQAVFAKFCFPAIIPAAGPESLFSYLDFILK